MRRLRCSWLLQAAPLGLGRWPEICKPREGCAFSLCFKPTPAPMGLAMSPHPHSPRAQLSPGLGDSRSEEATVSTSLMVLARISACCSSLMECVVCLSNNNVTIIQTKRLDGLFILLHLSVWISKHSLKCVLASKVQEPELCIRRNEVCMMCKICRGPGLWEGFSLGSTCSLLILLGWCS